ncbi:MAG: DnaD domain protein [Provencibacterium sp.]|nr:DnaD domain protein [Provencibacterium sp.]
MAYQLSFGIWGELFAVPTAIVDQHIQLCSAASLKALLVLLRQGGRALSLSNIAGMIGLSEPDTQDALNYWIASGILARDDGRSEDAAADDTAIPTDAVKVPDSSAAPAQEQKIIRTGSRPRLTQEMIADMAKKDGHIASLIQEAQVLLGGPISPTATEMLVSLQSYGGMPVEVILMVIQYCVSIGKSNVRYIEKTAYDWIDRGIDTFEKAERHMLEQNKANEQENKIKKAFGIHGRNLTAKEREYIGRWFNSLRFDLPMIQLAYERTIDKKGSFSFPYCDAILGKWFQKGIKTPRQAVDEMNAPFVPATSSGGPPSPARTASPAPAAAAVAIPRDRYDRAHAELQRRRSDARDTAARHKEEIYRILPRIREIDNKLSQTGLEVSRAVLLGGNTESLLQQLRDQNLALQKEKEQALLLAGYPTDYLEISYHCRECEDKGYRPDGEPCSCLKKLLEGE